MKYAFFVCLFFVACKAECSLGNAHEVNVAADLNCEVKSGPQVVCTVKQTKGTDELEACWDFTATCANGATLKAQRTCQKVKDGGEAISTTMSDKLTIAGECDGSPTAKVENFTINGKPATFVSH